jgi:hypothetical protein
VPDTVVNTADDQQRPQPRATNQLALKLEMYPLCYCHTITQIIYTGWRTPAPGNDALPKSQLLHASSSCNQL